MRKQILYTIFAPKIQYLKFLLAFFMIFTIAIRPVLPLVNYAVNYEYIVKNLCENRKIIDSGCKGKCFVKKELSKTENQSGNNQNIKIAGTDVFLSNEILSFVDISITDSQSEKTDSNRSDSHSSEYFSRIFHPPLA